MTEVELAGAALQDLDRLVRSHNLPADTRERFRHPIAPLDRVVVVTIQDGRSSTFA